MPRYNPNENEAHNELGFRVTDCTALNYYYESSSAAAEASSNGSEIYPDCTEIDKWTISDKRKLTHEDVAIEKCSS